MYKRRFFLKSLSSSLIYSAFTPSFSFGNMQSALPKENNYIVPIIMLHKVVDMPQKPEDISTIELLELFTFLFTNWYRPVNLSDIINNTGAISKIVKSGCKPFAVTVDDADPSVLFSKNNASSFGITADMPNKLSFVEIYTQSSRPYNITPKCTFFISESIPGVYDKRNLQRADKPTNKYFGGFMSLPAIVDFLCDYHGIELGYHTCEHIYMGDMNAKNTREVLEMQMTAFKELGVFDKVKPLFAYPYGWTPSPEGIQVIKELGFIGAVLAFPGTNEAGYTTTPMCEIDTRHRLINDPFFIPRTNVGAYIYAPPNPDNIAYERINPIEDLRKDFAI